MTYRIEITSSAARNIRKLPKTVVMQLLDRIEALAANPRPPQATKLVGEDVAWRLRVGNYRVIYEIHDKQLLIVVIRAAHRREVYKH